MSFKPLGCYLRPPAFCLFYILLFVFDKLTMASANRTQVSHILTYCNIHYLHADNTLLTGFYQSQSSERKLSHLPFVSAILYYVCLMSYDLLF